MPAFSAPRAVAAALQPGTSMRHHVGLALCLVLTGSLADAKPRHHHRRHHKVAMETSDDQVEAEAPVKLRTHVRDWQVAVGPYLWASSVDANVSLGSANVASSVDFLQTTEHAKYGVELLAEAR